jgi:hypothetical protein
MVAEWSIEAPNETTWIQRVDRMQKDGLSQIVNKLQATRIKDAGLSLLRRQIVGDWV